VSILGTIGSVAYPGQNNGAQERIREAAYTTPSGTRIEFEYERATRTTPKKGTVFGFAGLNEDYVQQHGFGSRQYPILAYFTGDNHDLEATAFEAGCLEDGFGLLESPRFGQVPVLCWGDVNRRDDLVYEVNQSVVEVTFSTSLKDLYPSALTNPRSEVLSALDGFDVQASQEFTAQTNLLTAASRATTKGTIKGVLKDISSALRAVSEVTADARREFADNFAVVNLGIDVLIGQPLLLVRQINNLILAPSRALAGIVSRLEGYRDLLDRMRASPAGDPAANYVGLGLLLRQQNDFQVTQLVAMSAVAGTVSSVVNTTFTTKPQALAAVQTLLTQFDDLVAWRDDGFVAVGVDDPGGAYQALYSAVALAAGYLIQISFQLVPERRITLGRARTIIDLCAELYGSVDDKLDLLINSNNLTGSEILELPKGRTIAYYPAR